MKVSFAQMMVLMNEVRKAARQFECDTFDVLISGNSYIRVQRMNGDWFIDTEPRIGNCFINACSSDALPLDLTDAYNSDSLENV